MAAIEFWIQLENKPWDLSPNKLPGQAVPLDRMTGQNMQQITGNAPVVKTLTSPETGVTNNVLMYNPLGEDALILRRYTANWAKPDDRMVNPWDLNEPDPTDNGTMGTIPGPVIECAVGDNVTVHFRNKDFRLSKALKARTHSLHPHGIVFENRYDGAYPLSPPDPTQPVGTEAAIWAPLGFGPTDSKKGDRVPPGGTFDYHWNTFGWPTTAGVWLYHDHSICDDANVMLGAIGILVIHNPADPDDVLAQDLPGGSPNGTPISEICFPFPFPVPLLPHDLNRLLAVDPLSSMSMAGGTGSMSGMTAVVQNPHEESRKRVKAEARVDLSNLVIKRDDITLRPNKDLTEFLHICLRFFRSPPQNALFLQLYHEMTGVGMLINGRKYLGNTPTLVAGTSTKMRFGLVAMNMMLFHTFHLHGHRWVIPGPDGNTGAGGGPGAIQSSPLVRAVSQFEDTRIFGPANSFVFTINEPSGSFMRAGGPNPDAAIGEWHMHCHVLQHMMDGMMGSLLIIRGGELYLGLPSGEPCPTTVGPPPQPGTVNIRDFLFDPANIMITRGQAVHWVNQGSTHTVTYNGPKPPLNWDCNPKSTEVFNSGDILNGGTFDHTFNNPGTFSYHCEIHGCGMAGTVTVM